MNGSLLIEKLIKYAETFLYLENLDKIYIRNLLLREFGLKEPYGEDVDLSFIEDLTVPDTLIEEVEEYAIANNLTTEDERELYSTYIFGLLTPLPSKVNDTFKAIKESDGIEKACQYLYQLSIKNYYIRKTAIDKNLMWEFKDGDNILEITVNLSKPEKSNKDIAKLLSAPVSKKYPKCLLCKENEGFEGSLRHPARENIRTVSLPLAGEDWFVQYSPYAYYDEHLIAINKNHTPMNVNPQTVVKLLDFVDYFPNYMIGSNASLPIVGGSILDHEHFQGGVHVMPMHKAPIKEYLVANDYPSIAVGLPTWYNSVIRLTSFNRDDLEELSAKIITAWKTYENKDLDIIAFTGETPHNTCSPIARMGEDGKYIVDIILRNNRTDERYPDGIFHAHPEYHNIKKEGIGLIEAMGLFILPGRLKKQLDMIADILCGKETYDETALNDKDNYLYVHRDMIKSLKARVNTSSKQVAYEKVVEEVNNYCARILENTAVFKNDEKGRKGFKEFCKAVGITERTV